MRCQDDHDDNSGEDKLKEETSRLQPALVLTRAIVNAVDHLHMWPTEDGMVVYLAEGEGCVMLDLLLKSHLETKQRRSGREPMREVLKQCPRTSAFLSIDVSSLGRGSGIREEFLQKV